MCASDLLLNVFQSVLLKYPLTVDDACFTCIVVPEPITEPVPPLIVKIDEVDSVKLPLVNTGSYDNAGISLL